MEGRGVSCRSEMGLVDGRGVLQWLGEGSCSWEWNLVADRRSWLVISV